MIRKPVTEEGKEFSATMREAHGIDPDLVIIQTGQIKDTGEAAMAVMTREEYEDAQRGQRI